MDDHTIDILFGGAIRMTQKKDGYRYSIDPVLLSHFAHPGFHDRVIDLGTGSGIIPAILSHRHPGLCITGIEIQPSLSALARKNIKDNNLDKQVTIICGDMTESLEIPNDSADLVLSNPPYTRYQAGRLNPNNEKAIARHEINIRLHELVFTASGMLKKGGRFALIFPQNRLVDLLVQLRNHGLEPRRLRMVHPMNGGPAKRVLVDAVKGGNPDLGVEPPLVIFQSRGIYSDEVKNMFL